MTCIVGYVDRHKKKSRITLGADSFGSNGHSGLSYKNSKLIKKENYILGACGSYRMMQLLKYKFNKDRIESEDDLFSDLPDQVIRLFKTNGQGKHFENDTFKGGTFLLGWDNRLFILQEDYSILEPPHKYTAIGAGQYIALGALCVLDPLKKDGEYKCKTALEAASDYILSVGPPFEFITL